jgi:two-component system cell cycle sensor histidine kinase/response regulator CckA
MPAPVFFASPDTAGPGLAWVRTASVHGWLDLAVIVVFASIPVLLWLWGRRQDSALRPVLSLLTVFVACCELAAGLWLFARGRWDGWGQVAGPVAAVGIAGGATVALVRLLPRRLRAEWDLRAPHVERLRLLEAAVGASRDGVMIAESSGGPDARLEIVYANEAFERMTGYAAEEAVGQSPSILPDRDAEPDALETIRAALRGTEPVRAEVPSKRKNGSRLWAEWQVVPVAGGERPGTHWVAFLRDTTERRRAEQAVRESEGRFRGLFEQAADALFVLGPSGRILDANRRACESLGYTWQELTSMTLDDIDADPHSVNLRPGDTATASGLHRRKDGTKFPVEMRLAILDAGGRRMILAMVRDVTRRRATELALREREELLRNVIAHIPCGVFWKDRNSVYLGCNQVVSGDHGFSSPDAVVGLTDFDLCTDRSEAQFYRECDRRVIDSGEALRNVEEMKTRQDGTKLALLTSKVPLRDTSGAVVGVLGVYQDLTERKKLEEQLRHGQKMEAIGRLAGGVAHDFNNLLTVILGNVHLLRQAPPSTPESPGLIEDIREASNRAAGLVRQLLTFSRRQPSCPEVIDLNEVVSGTVGLLRRLLGEKVVVQSRLSPEAVQVRADRGQLEQVVMNLAVNARDAMPDGGTLTITTDRVDAPESPEGAVARLTVTDTGCGMSEEVKARIFEPFFTTKGPDKGTGLGLATVYGIVQQAGGHIDVDSTPGAGATFRLHLPWCPASAAPTVVANRDATHRVVPGSGKSVLLVEDEDGVRKLARFALEGQGYQVAEAPDAETALGMLDPGAAVDLLVTDMTMPGMDGRELAGQVRLARPGVGVVFVSGYVPDAGRLDDIPGAIFLPKPFTPGDLLRAAGRAIRR